MGLENIEDERILNVLGLTRNELVEKEYPSSSQIDYEYMNDPRTNYFISAKLP